MTSAKFSGFWIPPLVSILDHPIVPGLQLFCKRCHRPVVYNHTSAIVLSSNHDSGFGDSNEIPLLSRLRFDSKDFGK